jgi:hypothetical protein
MISIRDYYGVKSHPALTPVVQANAQRFISKVNTYIAYLITRQQLFLVSPATKTQISTNVGGWRKPDCPSGSPKSSHKEGRGIDLYDGLFGAIGKFILEDKEAQAKAKELGLHFEHPSVTKGAISHWLHITDRAPPSGKLFFYP